MPNLNKGQTAWTNLMREFLQYIRFWRIAQALQFRMQKGRITVYELNDTTSKMSQWTFVGAKRGINCTEDGQLYITVTDETPGAGQARTQVYMDSGKTLLVAQGDAADGATATLAAQNNSGLTGTVKLGTITATLTPIILLLSIDETLKNQRAFDITTTGGVAANDAVSARVASLRTSFQSLMSTIKSDIQNGYVRTKLVEFLFSVESTVLSVSESTDTNGDAVIAYSGILADFINAMGDDTTPQSVLQNTVAAGSPAYDPSNIGSGVLSILNVRQNAEAGVLQLTCTAGKDTTLAEEWSAALLSSLDNAVLKGRLNLITKKEWESQTIGVRAKLARTITDTNDGSAQVANYVVNGETLDNTDAGKLYLTLETGSFAGGTNRRVRWYKDAALASLVAEGLRTGNGTVTMGAMNNSGLTGSCDITYVSDDLDIIVNLNPWKVGDIITVAITNDRAGVVQSLFMDLFDLPLPSSGSPTLPDSLIKEATDHLLT
jgi:hypothetical protein